MNGRIVAFIDVAGVSHLALVAAVNGLHPDRLTLVYIDQKAPDTDNIKKMFDVVHASDSSKDENNPAKPRYVFNAWRELDESHLSLPRDHPNFDHPFKRQDVAQNGVPIPIDRPVTDALDAAHLETLDPDDATELAALSGSGGMAGSVGHDNQESTPDVGVETLKNSVLELSAELDKARADVTDKETTIANLNRHVEVDEAVMKEMVDANKAKDATIAQLTEQLNQRPTDPPPVAEAAAQVEEAKEVIVTDATATANDGAVASGEEGEDSAADAPAPEPPPAA
jgi:hypothetical protein